MKKIHSFLLLLFSFSVFAQSSYDRIWAVNSGINSNIFHYSSYLVNDTDLYYPSDNKIVYYNLPNTTPIEFAVLGTATSTIIDALHRDTQGNFYVSGLTTETQNFTTTNVFKPTFNPNQDLGAGTNGFLAKFDVSGDLLFCTYTDAFLQGGFAKKMTTTDALGNIYFIAYLPITETLPNAPFQTSVSAAETMADNFLIAPIITKLDSNGQLQWKTFFCHHLTMISNIDVVNNQLVIAGHMTKNPDYEMTNPTFFSTPGVLLENVGSLTGRKTFVNVFNTDGTRAWGTYLSTGTIHGLRTFGNAIYVLHQGNGLTATEGAYFGTPKTNILTKLSNTGTRLWSNYIDSPNFNLDLSGNVFLFGKTQQSTGIATADAYQATKNPTNNGFGINLDGFHQILSQNGTDLLYGTYYGLQGEDATSMIIPRNSGYISLGYINNYPNPTDFITQGNPLTTSENYSNYEGFIISLFDKTPLSTDTFQLENVKVYPNPTVNYLIIENLDGFSTNDTVEVYNILGQKIQKQNVLSETTLEINTENWSSGLYIVNVQSNGKVGSYKVVKK